MTWLQKLDKFYVGLLIGIFFPMVVFTGYWLFTEHQISFPRRYIKYLLDGQLLSGVIKICGIGNLALFYFGLTKKIDKFTKGIIVSVIVYVALVAYVTYYLEVDLG